MTILVEPEGWGVPNEITAPSPLDNYLRLAMQLPHDFLENLTEKDRAAFSQTNCPVPIRTATVLDPKTGVVTGHHPDKPDEPVAWWDSDGYRLTLSEPYVRECYEEGGRVELFLLIHRGIFKIYQHLWETLKQPEFL